MADKKSDDVESVQSQVNKTSDALVEAFSKDTGFSHPNFLNGLMSFLSNKLSKVQQTREKYFNDLIKFRNNYITTGIYNIISNDVFVSNNPADTTIINIGDDEELSDEIKDLFSSLNIYDLVQSFLPDLLHYGSYPLRPVVKDGLGVTALLDDLEPKNVICVADSSNFPLFYFISNKKDTSDIGYLDYTTRQQFEIKSNSEVLQFNLDLSHSKLELPEKLVKSFKEKLASTYPNDPELQDRIPNSLKIKTSMSFIWGAIDKLRETLLMDKISVYKNLAMLLSPTLVGVPVPDNYDVDKLVQVTRKYDEIINGNTARLNSVENLDFTLQDVSNVKVVPIAGDRTNPTPLDTGKSERSVDPNLKKDSLENTLQSLGIPLELFIGEKSAKENFRVNVRYAKTIKRIQKNICKCLSLLALLHISRKYPDKEVFLDDINIQLKSNINTDELENLEAQDLIITSTRAMLELVNDIGTSVIEGSGYTIDKSKIVDTIKDSLASIGSPYQNIFILSDEEPSTPPEPPETIEQEEE